MKPQHLLLTALAGVGLGGAVYWLSSSQDDGGKPSDQEKTPGGKGSESGADPQGYVPKPDPVWNPPGKKWVVGGWESDWGKWEAVLEYHNKTKEKIALAPGITFDEQGKMHTTMPILVADPRPVM